MSRRRSRSQRRTSLRDHAWGGALGLVFILFLAGFFFGARIAGAGGATCDKPLPAMQGRTDITAQGFVAEDAALGRVIDFLYAGDRNSADDAFYGPVHSFTHNVDPAVRPASQDTAKVLCNAVIRLEGHLAEGSQTNNITIAQDTATVRDALRQAAAALGYPRPGESSP